ncbi:MAG: T9SS type A sorting domain-containing protein, partial [Lentimicrobiaceae bacterium]|nr:T9SS type A sorting domain-containing protein [Lentimicrobiaceae bacterium]MBE6336168.1 T9SS type A sorting domain-containing protein [Lentimicrobiaceae bacterium]
NIDVSGLCSGIYIAKIYLEDGTIVSKKIVKR